MIEDAKHYRGSVAVSCPCGSDELRVVGVKNCFRLVECQACGMVYVNPQPTPEEVAGVYSTDYWYEHQVELGLPTIQDRISTPKERAHFSDVLKWLLKRCPLEADDLLLDIGCSHGMFCRLAADVGYRVMGIEMDAEIAALGREQMGVDIHVGSLMEQCFAANTFDTVTMFDVLEHLPRPHDELAEIYRILRPGGVLYLATPCRDSPEARDVLQWGETKPPEHLFLYAFRDVAKLLRTHHFHVWDAMGLYSSRMFVLAKRDATPPQPFVAPPFWRWQAAQVPRKLGRALRRCVRNRSRHE